MGFEIVCDCKYISNQLFIKRCSLGAFSTVGPNVAGFAKLPISMRLTVGVIIYLGRNIRNGKSGLSRTGWCSATLTLHAITRLCITVATKKNECLTLLERALETNHTAPGAHWKRFKEFRPMVALRPRIDESWGNSLRVAVSAGRFLFLE
jgi:hypothetical protein